MVTIRDNTPTPLFFGPIKKIRAMFLANFRNLDIMYFGCQLALQVVPLFFGGEGLRSQNPWRRNFVSLPIEFFLSNVLNFSKFAMYVAMGVCTSFLFLLPRISKIPCPPRQCPILGEKKFKQSGLEPYMYMIFARR